MNIVTAKAYYWVMKKGNAYAMFLGQRSIKHSQMGVHYVYHRGDEWRVYTPDRNAIIKYYKENGGDFVYEMVESLTVRWFSQSGISLSSLLTMEAEGILKEKSFNEKEFIKWLRTDKGMSLEEIGRTGKDNSGTDVGFGLKVEVEESDIVNLHGARVLFKDNVKDEKRREILGYLDTVRKRLESHGFGYIFPGDTVIADLAETKAGWYYNGPKEIHVDPNAGKEVIEVLYHEYGHKLWHEHMSAEQQQIVKERYRAEKGSVVSDKDLGKFYRRLFSTNTKLKWKDGKVYKVYKMGPSYLTLDFTATTTKSISWRNVPKDLTKEDGTPLPTPKNYGIESNMFPSEYSKTKDTEWFAEIFAFYLMDKATEEINKFLVDLLARKGKNPTKKAKKNG
jgi:hypothetical protein